MYLEGIETVHNRDARNEDYGVRREGLIIFTETARPIGQIRKHVEMSQELRDIAHWFLLYNSPEIEKYLQYVFLIIIYILTFFMLLVINNSSISLINQNYLSREHKNLLQIPSGQDITQIQQKEFPKWFKEYVSHF